MKVRRLFLGILALGLSLLCGCMVPQDTSGVVVVNSRLYVYNPAFAVNVAFVQDAIKRTPEGFLQVQTTVQSTNRDDWHCQYRFVWFDMNGMMQTHAPSPWRPCVLHGAQTTVLEVVSPLRDAGSFRLEIRPGEDWR